MTDLEQLRAENARLRETTEKLITALDKIEQQADYGQVDACQRIASAALSAYPAPVSNGPDWEGFGRDLMENFPKGDIDGRDLFDLALNYRLIIEVPGGYDPEEHIDAEGICPEKGDPWFEYNFRGERQ